MLMKLCCPFGIHKVSNVGQNDEVVCVRWLERYE